MKTETVGLVVAAGRGQRFGGGSPKQYVNLGGRPLLRYSLERLSRHPSVDAVRTVIHPEDRVAYEQAAAGFALLEPVAGGATRQASVRNGLESLVALNPLRVLIHDGARPLVSDAVIRRVRDALDSAAGAIAAIPVTDTLKREADGRVTGTVSRAGLWNAQTPQGFRFDPILAAHRAAADRDLTDDAAVAELAGLDVVLVVGDIDNLKVTGPDDLVRAERLLGAHEFRTGNGFDVHRFSAGDHVMLCGVRIPHDGGLLGHSDADVGLHALTDAVLGALSAGDIGMHFPATDPRWRDADSASFLRHACELAAARGAAIMHVDITLICERPKIHPHREAMIFRTAELLGVEHARVSIKATTTEGLGFTGRREGIAAQATATLRLPPADCFLSSDRRP